MLSVGWNDAHFGLSVEQWVNDEMMTLFFLIVGIEIKREVVAGELSYPKRAALPIVAAIGGMAVPALIFFAINYGTRRHRAGACQWPLTSPLRSGCLCC